MVGEIILHLPAEAWVQPWGFFIYLTEADDIMKTFSYARNAVFTSISKS